MVSGPRMRQLERFATAHGLQLAVEPAAERRAARLFGRSEFQDAVAWFAVPGPVGFEVGQHVERIDIGGSENEEMRRRWTWAAFTLRQTGRSADASMEAIRPMLPRRWEAEVAGSELFLMATGPRALTSPRLWRMLHEIQQTLRPVLAHPARTTSAAERARRGIRLQISS